MTSPWVPVEPLDDAAFAAVRRRAIFDCHKWDPQVGDVCTIARHPLVIARAAWDEVVCLARALAARLGQGRCDICARMRACFASSKRTAAWMQFDGKCKTHQGRR